MSKVTTELRFIVENGINIFDFNYNIFDETYKETLQRNFIRHFYFKEIGTETIAKFKMYLEDKFITVFPKYNKMMEISLIEYDIVNNVDVTETFSREVEETGETLGSHSSENISTSSGENTHSDNSTTNTNDTIASSATDKGNTTNTTNRENVNKYLDTPQNSITDLSTTNYLTDVRVITDNDSNTININNTNTTSSTSTSENTLNKSVNETYENSNTINASNSNTINDNKNVTETTTLKRKGNIGVMTASDLIKKHLDLQMEISNIEIKFFNECKDLFMMVY